MKTFFKKQKCPYVSDDNRCIEDDYSLCENKHKSESHYKGCPVFEDITSRKRNFTNRNILGFFLFAIILLFIDYYVLKEDCFFKGFLINIACSIIAGLILVLVVDIPSKLKEYELSFLNALSSDNYLKKLDRNKLKHIRKQATEELYSKNLPYSDKSLLNLDNEICSQLTKIYCKDLVHEVYCKFENTDYIRKKHKLEYTLINPKNTEEEEILKLKNTVYIKKDNTNKNGEYFENMKFTVIVDCKLIDITPHIKYKYEPADAEKLHYNTKITIYSDDNPEGYPILFKKTLKIFMSYETLINKDDICYTKRMKYPTKGFRLDYFFDADSDKIKLYGQLFGTMIDQRNIRISSSIDNKISIETREWLLPQDGATVIHKEK